jgi:hypothetical protein
VPPIRVQQLLLAQSELLLQLPSFATHLLLSLQTEPPGLAQHLPELQLASLAQARPLATSVPGTHWFASQWYPTPQPLPIVQDVVQTLASQR